MFHYLSTTNNISIDVYRHTLFISINGPLTGDANIAATVRAYTDACAILNEEYLYWGQIISVNSRISLSANVAALMLSGKLNEGLEQRKCVSLVILPTEDSDQIHTVLANYLPDVPTEVFSTIPRAMKWNDDFMNHYAASQFER